MIQEVTLMHPERFTTPSTFKAEKLDTAIEKVLERVDYMMMTLNGAFPPIGSTNLVYPFDGNNFGWNQGFWTGILWLAYELSGDEKYKRMAESHLDSFRVRIENKLGVNHHDMGFLYTPSCVAAYKLTHNESAKKTAIMASDHLMTRYFEKGGFIQAWGDVGDPECHMLIVDCLLNIPLLFWASEVTGDAKYETAARRHLQTTMHNSVRSDATTFHTFFFDPQTDEPVRGATAQGASADSCWARGQAWSIYGMALGRAHTEDEETVHLCKQMTHVYLNKLPADLIPYWDLIFTEGDEPRDSSSSAIVACGLLELLKYLPQEDSMRSIYENAAEKMMESLYENYTVQAGAESNGLLLHATDSKPHKLFVDECCIFGDYYYMEALVRMKKDWVMYW